MFTFYTIFDKDLDGVNCTVHGAVYSEIKIQFYEDKKYANFNKKIGKCIS